MQVPTHFRFKSKKAAKHWGRTTKDWIPISEIYIRNGYMKIAAVSFAWVYIDKNIELGIKPSHICKS